MCAFMMPVVKNDWDVYKVDKRSRNNSESSGAGGGGVRRSRSGAPGAGRRPRHMSEGGRSQSYHVAPSSYHDLQHVNAKNRAFHSHANSRHQSQGSFAGDLASPAKSSQSFQKNNNGPSKSTSSNSLNKFHNKVMDKLKSALNLRDHDNESSENEVPEDTRSQS